MLPVDFLETLSTTPRHDNEAFATPFLPTIHSCRVRNSHKIDRQANGTSETTPIPVGITLAKNSTLCNSYRAILPSKEMLLSAFTMFRAAKPQKDGPSIRHPLSRAFLSSGTNLICHNGSVRIFYKTRWKSQPTTG